MIHNTRKSSVFNANFTNWPLDETKKSRLNFTEGLVKGYIGLEQTDFYNSDNNVDDYHTNKLFFELHSIQLIKYIFLHCFLKSNLFLVA